VCFSAEADVIAGVVVGGVGVDALRHVRRTAELPLASVPLVLAAHQLTESFVWWGLDGRVSHTVGHGALWLYLVIAFGVLPVLVPSAVAALEPETDRRRMVVFTAIGAVVAGVLLYAVVRGPVSAAIEGRHLAYRVDLWHGGVIVALYVLATCGPMLVSRHQHVRWFGGANLLAAALLTWLATSAFISLWCAWAAMTSVAIALHLRAAHPRPPVAAAPLVPLA
jgi:hypothetical protein